MCSPIAAGVRANRRWTCHGLRVHRRATTLPRGRMAPADLANRPGCQSAGQCACLRRLVTAFGVFALAGASPGFRWLPD